MIVEWAMKLADVVVKVVFSLLGVLPSMPDSVTSVVDNFFDLIFVGVSIFNFFVPLNFVVVLIPIVIAIVNFDKLYKLVMWILRKIPFIGVE
jgi:hypothetical protein